MKKVVVLLLLLILPSVLVVHAQQAPLVFLIDQDLWTWVSGDTALMPLTNNAYVRDVALSPDGTRLAALVLSPVTIDAVQRVGGFSGYWPVDIVIIKISTGAITTVAPQPDDARLFAADGSPDNAWLRGLPAWSPDGTKLVWTEMHYPTFAPEENRLVIYDTATATAVVLEDSTGASVQWFIAELIDKDGAGICVDPKGAYVAVYEELGATVANLVSIEVV